MKKVILLLGIGFLFSCNKNDALTETVSDIDGNVYNTVTIGTQVWMKENLKTTKYRNGELIGTTTPATKDYRNEIEPKYQWACEGYEDNVAIYGRLYTWHVVNDSRNICPTGWHVPSDAEWTTLVTFLGGDSIAGGKLKERGTTHWLSPNSGATNETGFSAIPGGVRHFSQSFNYFGYINYWWSSTEYISISNVEMVHAYFRYVKYNSNDITSTYYIKVNGMSVRCIKDN